MSPFTTPPDYSELEKLENHIGSVGVLEPINKLYDQKTKHGIAPVVWECILWVLDGDHLEPKTGIKVFSKKLCQQLDVANRTNAPIAGMLVKGPGNSDGPKVLFDNSDKRLMAMLEKAWETVSLSQGKSHGSDEEEPF